jgi:hypothetical protein
MILLRNKVPFHKSSDKREVETCSNLLYKDYEGLCELFDEGDALHRQALPDTSRKPDGPARTKEYIYNIIASENANLFCGQ